MKITVTLLETDRLFMVEVPADLELVNFKVCCEHESGILVEDMIVSHEGRMLLDEARTLKAYGIKDCDCVRLSCDGGSRPAEGTVDDIELSADELESLMALQLDDFKQARVRELFSTSPAAMRLLWRYNPPLAVKLEANDLVGFSRELAAQLEMHRQLNERLRQVRSPPSSEETQQSNAVERQHESAQENMERAMKLTPDIYSLVSMLFINCKVNGTPVQAFVDSGAQATMMSDKCAERCHVKRLMDTRWCGNVKGVGTSRIIGRIHLVQIEIEQDQLVSSITVLEEPAMDMLLGLDMLKRHQCLIDLQRNVLRIGSTGTETSFLAEGDLHTHKTEIKTQVVLANKHESGDGFNS